MLQIRTRREAAWRELSRWLCPWRGRFDAANVDHFDSGDITLFTGMQSAAVLRAASGITSGMTPRNIAWFRTVFSDPAMMDLPQARAWLDLTDERMRDCLADGGFYQAIQQFNIDLVWAGCALLYTERTVGPLRYECCQVGTYCVACDHDGRLAEVARLILMPLGEAGRVFGKEKFKNYERRPKTEEIRVWHLARDTGQGMKPIASIWWEEGAEEPLRHSGFYEMPYFFAAWNDGATPYGTGPGDECLADARQLDMLERHKLSGLGKLADPPVLMQPSLKDVCDLEPGGITYGGPNDLIRPILDLAPLANSIRWIQEEIAKISQRLDRGLMADVFASIPLDQRPSGMSATEFLERKREALQQLGPIISAYEPTVLTPLLHRTANTLYRAGLTPPPPPALAGRDLALKLDFISPMANALRQTGAETARAFFLDVAQMFQTTQQPEIFDKVDLDQMIDELATGLGVPGSIIRSDQETTRIRQQRQQAQQQAQAIQQQQLQQEQGIDVMKEVIKQGGDPGGS